MENATVTARQLAAQQRYQQRYRAAVATLAKYQAKKRITAMVRAQGRRPSDFTCRELSLMAESYLAEHREELTTLMQPLAEQILRKR